MKTAYIIIFASIFTILLYSSFQSKLTEHHIQMNEDYINVIEEKLSLD